MCKSILKGQTVPGTDGTYHGTDGTCLGTDGTHTRGCPAKILYVYLFFLSPFKGKMANFEAKNTVKTGKNAKRTNGTHFTRVWGGVLPGTAAKHNAGVYISVAIPAAIYRSGGAS